MDRRFNRSTRGVYYASSGILAVVTTAHTSLQGFIWLVNPITSLVVAFVRRVRFRYSAAALAAANTRLTIERITFADGPPTAVIAPLQRHSAEPAPSCLVLSATTGITPVTVAANAPLYTSWAIAVITAVGVVAGAGDELVPQDEDSYIRLLPGEGIVVRQPDAGITTDPRKAAVGFEWEEFDSV